MHAYAVNIKKLFKHVFVTVAVYITAEVIYVNNFRSFKILWSMFDHFAILYREGWYVFTCN